MITKWNPTFPNDTNILLQEVQYTNRNQMAVQLFTEPAKKYLYACALLELDNFLYHSISDALFFKPIPLEKLFGPYDHIAAYYRMKVDKHGQLPIPFSNDSDPKTVFYWQWRKFFEKQIVEICDDVLLTRLFVKLILLEDENAKSELEFDLFEKFNVKYSLQLVKNTLNS